MKHPLKRLFLCSSAILFGILCLGLVFIQGPVTARSTVRVAPGENVSQSKSSTNQTQPELKSLSPDDIESFIRDNPQASLKPLWQRLGITSDPSDDPIAHSLEVCGHCKVEEYQYDLDDEPGEDVLLRISGALACRYLIFKFEKKDAHLFQGKWKLLGYIDEYLPKMYSLPRLTVVISGGKRWLLVEGLCGTGSAFSSDYSHLFQVSSDGVKELLSYWSSGLQCWAGHYSQVFESRLMNCEVNNGITTVEVQFTLSYYSGVDDSLLWRKQQRAIFATDAATGNLVLDRHKSDISEPEMKEIYENDNLGSDYLLKYNLKPLAEIATGKNREHKQWLREFLNKCHDSPERAALQQMLDR